VREFYAEGANAINCSCAQVSVLLDENGEVATPGIVERVRQSAGGGESPYVNAGGRQCHHEVK
jgi:hypothetical protein